MFKHLLRNTLLTATFALFTATSNAALITQDLIFDDLTTAEVVFETIGTITVDTTKADPSGVINSWEEFSLFGLDIITEEQANDPSSTQYGLFGLFAAEVDETNLNAGIEFLTFDVIESAFEFYNFSGLVDTATGDNFIFDIFDFNGGLYAFGDLALGDASVVSEPSMLILFMSGLFIMFSRKKNV